ncbi:nitrate reductase cytochrome c-type subunit [Povalibacter sp.]|uniref:nitrate reductase cytochrome c-type subunit n=1 Tax=Povalibacter sp. TaxID=1962978 RepID=UPI002F41FAFC
MSTTRWLIAGVGTAIIALAAVSIPADELANGLRGPTPLNQEPKAPKIWPTENKDVKRGRAYTSQPPTIPHTIEKYEITRNVNMCMYCHARVRNNEFGAPMVSATHYMDREFDFLAEISPRRYFCTQCHVPQAEVTAPVGNTFMDVDEIIAKERAASKAEPGEKPP